MEHEKIIYKIIVKWNEENSLNLPVETLKTFLYAISNANIPYSSKQAKKASQKYRREARNVFTGYQDKLKENLTDLNRVLRKRPKYIHNGLWRFGANLFIDISAIEKPIFKKKEDLSTD